MRYWNPVVPVGAFLERRSARKFRERYGPWALVTGGALGIGRGFARRLAARGVSLLLVDRNEQALAETAEAARAQGVSVETLAADLRDAKALEEVCEWVPGDGRELGLLVNNAGIGHVGRFLDIPLEDHQSVVDLNVRAPMLLSYRLAPRLVARGRGGIIMLSSSSAFAGSPGVAHYAATKGYNWLLAEALLGEFSDAGVDCLAVLPGLTHGTNATRSLSEEVLRKLRPQHADDVAEDALRALGQKAYVVTGPGTSLSGHLRRLLPRKRMLRSASNRLEMFE